MSRTSGLRKNVSVKTYDINDKAVFTSIGIHIADYYALRDSLIAKRKSILLSDDDKQDLMRQVSALQPMVSEALEGGAASFEQLKKLIAQSQRIITQANAPKEMPFGEKSEALIYVITRAVMYQLDKMRSTEPAQYNRYVSGEETRFWLNTKTASLNTSLNRSELGADLVYADRKTKRDSKKYSGLQASLRGAKGLYASVMDTGFVLEKEVVNNAVKLCIDLNWLFSPALNVLTDLAEKSSDNANEPSFSGSRGGLSTPLSQNVSTIVETKLTEYNEDGVENLGSLLISADFQPVVEPTIVGKKEKVEGEVEVFTSTVETPTIVGKKEKVDIAPGAAGATIALDFAKDSANRALKQIFNQKNMQEGRICFNQQSICQIITAQDIKDFSYWMLEAYQNLRLEGENWSEVAELVNEAIENTAKYLNEHPTRKIYHPRFWTNPYFTGGSLCHYVKTYLRERIDTDQPKMNTHTPQILWFLENGANRNALFHYIGKHGETLVSDAIAFAGAKIARGFAPIGGKVPYIFGILKNLNPETIQYQLATQKAKLSGKNTQPLQGWTISRVEKIISSLKITSRQELLLTPSVVEAIAKRADEKKVEKAQVEAWLEAICQGKSTQFQ
jgi:hypothetical protein